MIPSVMPAFRLSGGLKAGTPLEMASVPVIAEQPAENALSTNRRVSPSRPGASPTCGMGSRLPVAQRNAPTTMSPPQSTMNEYVGMEKSVPDSRSPRRLAKATNNTIATAMTTRQSKSAGNAEVMAATPEATLTATVIT